MDSTLRDLLTTADDTAAVIDAHRTWTRADLAGACRSVGAELAAAGVAPGDRVMVECAPRGEVVAALLGARATGALVLPVSTHELPAASARLRPSCVITNRPLEGVRTLSPESLLRSVRSFEPRSGPGDAYGMTTSGTTGGAKTVLLTEASIAHMTEVLHLLVEYRRGDQVLCCPPLHHVYGLSQLWFAARTGATLLFPPAPLLPGTVAEWGARASVVAALPSTLRSVLAVPPPWSPRIVTLGGQGTQAAERVAFSRALPETRFLQFYGLTEAFRVLWLSAEEFLTAPESSGRPTPGMRAWLDEDGELWVQGPNVARGYLDDPEATAAKFVQGTLRTGDLFCLSGGGFSHLGRRDGVFKTFGEKVVPEVVERILQLHPRVERTLVTHELINGEIRPVALVQAGAGPPPSAAELIRLAVQKLPSAMVPARIDFVRELPTTSTGKLLRRTANAIR
jgi:acyl-CoA synthetase (AMP-forming)/AMP-acid ligase II